MLRIEFVLASLMLQAAAQAQNATPEARSREMIDHALHSSNPEERMQAVAALSLVGPRAPYDAMLTSMLDDKDVEVRLATVAGLAEWKGKSGLDALHRAMNDPAPEVGFAAAKALWSRHDPAGRETLAAVLSGEMRTASGFLTVQKREAFHMMHTPKAMFLFAVEQGMGFVPLPGFGEGVASMQGLLADTGVSGRATAALLLGNDRGADTQAALIDALTDKEWQVRAAAIHSLALRNDPAMLDHLLPLLEDHKEAVRLRAAAACIRLEMVQAGNAPGKAKRRYRKAS